jgi:hypothetical protein
MLQAFKLSIMECKIENANFDRVFSIIETLQRDRFRSVCSCGRCTCDVAALALNYLPPHYFANGAKAAENEAGSPWVMVETAVIAAIARVQEYPHHPVKSGGASHVAVHAV